MADVVARTGVEHYCVWPDPEELLKRLGEIAWHMDEPYGSTSIFAEWKVFETVATTDVKVTLDGHGGDEILAGYRDFAGPFLGALLRSGNISAFTREVVALSRHGNASTAQVAAMIFDELAPDAARNTVRRWAGRATPRPDWINLTAMGAEASDPFRHAGGIGGVSRSQLAATSLPMQLRWNDRNSMAFSIESRAPFLDVRLVEMTLRLDPSFKISNGVSKAILRKALGDLLPESIVNRRDKMGFVTPEVGWMRGPAASRFRASALATADRCADWFTPAAKTMVEDVAAGRRRYDAAYWRLISFGAWMDRFGVDAG